jgi:mycofactocin system glycosyltransferase
VRSSTGGHATLDAYEAGRSPLDLGPEPARIAAGTRVGYVPAAALVCRTAALQDVGLFDESLRFGEDVDLVWRLVASGYRCRYEPATVVTHRSRATIRSWLQQRAGYGSSAAPLHERHPGALAPLRISGWSALAWGLVAIRRPVAGVAVGLGTTAALARKLPDLPGREIARLGGLGNLYAGRQVADAVTRAWWPLVVPLAVVVRRVRWPLLAAFVVPALLDWRTYRRRRDADEQSATPLDPLRYTVLHIADDVAYSVGVWRGIRRRRSVAVLRPTLTNWPPRGDG